MPVTVPEPRDSDIIAESFSPSFRRSAAGVPDTFVAQMLGHSTTSILPSYAKAIDEYRRDAIRKLDELRKTEVATTSPGPPTSPTIN